MPKQQRAAHGLVDDRLGELPTVSDRQGVEKVAATVTVQILPASLFSTEESAVFILINEAEVESASGDHYTAYFKPVGLSINLIN